MVGDLSKEINAVAGGYATVEDGCGSNRAMLNGLGEMELDLHEQIHKESNILYPSTLEFARTVTGN